jgi:hypothetical protein
VAQKSPTFVDFFCLAAAETSNDLHLFDQIIPVASPDVKKVLMQHIERSLNDGIDLNRHDLINLVLYSRPFSNEDAKVYSLT